MAEDNGQVTTADMDIVPRQSAKEKAEDVLRRLKSDVVYGVTDVPPWYISLFMAIQHYLLMFSSTLPISIILANAMCVSTTDVARGELAGTIFFASGLITLLQVLFGVRLPILQGGSFSFLAPTFALLADPKWGECPTDEVLANMTKYEAKEVWQTRMREVQGSIIVASCFEVFIGFTGIIGLILPFIGPLVIAPVITLIGIVLFENIAVLAGKHWGISFLTFVLVALFSQYMRNLNVPCFGWKKNKGCAVNRFPFFKLFPVILSVLLVWLLCYILTITDVLPNDKDSYGYDARTDLKNQIIADSKWFRFPYPGQWGMPTVSAAGVLGMLAGALSSMIESVGDYYACARLAGAPQPPTHAINRGICMEGIGCILAGLWGTGNGSTSYSSDIGSIGITKVGSRMVWIVFAIISMLLGCFGKLGAVFVTIPDPVIGGIFITLFGLVVAVGISNLQFVDLNSTRNLFITGSAIILGLSVPKWMKTNPGVIDTGIPDLNQVITVLMGTGMFVGGLIAFILDNTIPGTPEERGITKWRRSFGAQDNNGDDADDDSEAVRREVMRCYDFPFGNNAIYKNASCTKFIPVCPTFRGFGRGRLHRKKADLVEASSEHIRMPVHGRNDYAEVVNKEIGVQIDE